jgi:hypothetical protein
MFYKAPHDQIIRQGDIIKGLISPGVITHKFLDNDNIDYSNPSFSIDVRFNLVAVITPCCTIQKADYISLCPLNPLLKDIHKNPHLIEDPTRLNQKVKPENCLPPNVWENILPSDIKQKRIELGSTYIYMQNFVFKKHNGILNNDVMIDFNNIFNIRRKDLGNNNEKMLPSKLLQLSDETREILRHKLSAYYLRVPE